MVVSPPINVRSEWVYFFSPDDASDSSSPGTQSSLDPLTFDRIETTGYWRSQPASFCPSLYIEADHCSFCGRPQLATAEAHPLPDAWVSGSLRFPYLFCTHQSGASPILTKSHARRSFGSYSGVLLQGAVPTSLMGWARSCVPSAAPPTLLSTPWTLNLPSPWPKHPTPQPATLSILSLNLGGVGSKKEALTDLLQALAP